MYLEKSIATTTVRPVFYLPSHFLDFVCYWHDKNNAVRLNDFSHAYFSHYYDALVSNNKRMRVETKAVYSCLGVQTKAYSGDEFLRED